jgi:hypothetical protein
VLFAIATMSKKLASLVIGEVGGTLLENFDFDIDMVAELEGKKFKGPLGKIADYKLAGLPLLSSLHVKNWHHTQMIPVARILSFFAQCPQLISVSVTNCEGVEEDVLLQMTDTLRSPFCAQLQTIHFDENYNEDFETICEVGDTFMAQIGSNCPNLTSLSVYCSSEGLSNIGLQRLSRCTKLTVLTLRVQEDSDAEQAATDAGLSQLATCRELTSVSLEGFDHFTDDGVSQFAKQLPKLTSLEIHGCLLLNGAFTATLPQLTALSLSAGSTGPVSLSASEMCPKLSRLMLRTRHVSVGGWHFPVLRKLTLTSRNATDAILTAIGDGCPLLRVLWVCGDDAFSASAEITGNTTAYFQNLVSLKMEAPKVTGETLESLISRCPKLTKVVASRLVLTPEVQSKIAAARPLLQIKVRY